MPLAADGISEQDNTEYTRAMWDCSPDGQRFLLIVAAEGTPVSPITVVLNWAAEQKELRKP